MAGPSYRDFTDVYDIPYTVIAFLYTGIVILFTLAVIITRLCGSCCCSCDKLSDLLKRFNSWMIRLIFGKSEGVSEEDEDDENLQIDNNIYINGKKLKTIDINILGAIILIFGLLVAINAYGAYLLEVTHTCSDDTTIHCYPLLLNSSMLLNNSEQEPNDTLSDLVEDFQRETQSMPIENCSEWTDPSVAPYITFQCFRYALNADTALAIAGGLLALFTIVMRTTISIITKIFQKCHLHKCKTFTTVVQVIVAFFLLILDIGAAIVVIAFQLLSSLGMVDTEVDPLGQQIAAYIADNGIQFVVATGTIALLLLIPWADYTDKNKPPSESQKLKNESSPSPMNYAEDKV